MKTKAILIVDDEERNVKLLKGMIMPENYEVATAFSGREALVYLEANRPDLILLDVMMPDIDGFEVCRRLKQSESTQVIPVVMVTALAEKQHRIRAMEVGADDFLSKPVDRTELLVRMKSLLRIKSYHDKLYASYEEITAKNRRLEELEQAKEELTYMIVHDLMNPLTVISMGLDLLLLDKTAFTGEQLKTFQQCFHNCDELKRMIQSLLDIHRMEDGKLKPVMENFDIGSLIDDLIGCFEAGCDYQQIDLRFERRAGLNPVCGDQMLIKRIISNLISNAFRHTPPGGKVQVAVTDAGNDGGIQVSVCDNGEGIDPQYHQKIFERFEQVDLRRAGTQVGSSGLGLAFCKMAVEAHGGKIWVESDGNGQGASFRFSLPLRH